MLDKANKLNQLNNKGLSIVELVVVLAIMSVMLGIVGFSVNMLIGAEARQAANKMVAQLNDAKTGAMSRAGEYLVLKYEDTKDETKGIDKQGYYTEKKIYYLDNEQAKGIKDSPEDDEEFARIASKKVTITIGDEVLDQENEMLVFRFDRATGALKCAKKVADTEDAAETSKATTPDFYEIVFKSGLREYKVKIEKVTGSVSIAKS